MKYCCRYLHRFLEAAPWRLQQECARGRRGWRPHESLRRGWPSMEGHMCSRLKSERHSSDGPCFASCTPFTRARTIVERTATVLGMYAYISATATPTDARMWRWQDFPPAHTEWSSCAVPRILQFLAKSAISFPAIGSSGQPSEACCGEMNIGREAAGTRHSAGPNGWATSIRLMQHTMSPYHIICAMETTEEVTKRSSMQRVVQNGRVHARAGWQLGRFYQNAASSEAFLSIRRKR